MRKVIKRLGLSDLRVSIKLCRLSIGAVTPNWLSNLVLHTIDPLSSPKFWRIRFRLLFLLSIVPKTLKLKWLNARKFYNAGKTPEGRLRRTRSVRKLRSASQCSGLSYILRLNDYYCADFYRVAQYWSHCLLLFYYLSVDNA